MVCDRRSSFHNSEVVAVQQCGSLHTTCRITLYLCTGDVRVFCGSHYRLFINLQVILSMNSFGFLLLFENTSQLHNLKSLMGINILVLYFVNLLSIKQFITSLSFLVYLLIFFLINHSANKMSESSRNADPSFPVHSIAIP